MTQRSKGRARTGKRAAAQFHWFWDGFERVYQKVNKISRYNYFSKPCDDEIYLAALELALKEKKSFHKGRKSPNLERAFKEGATRSIQLMKMDKHLS